MEVNGGRKPLGALSTGSHVFGKTGIAERWGCLLGKEWRWWTQLWALGSKWLRRQRKGYEYFRRQAGMEGRAEMVAKR